jgi:hypothetical protein
VSYADRDAALGEALRQRAAETLRAAEADAACAAAGAWYADDAADGERWTLCALCGWPRGTGHAPGCGFRVAPAATAALWGLARAVAWATTKEGA